MAKTSVLSEAEVALLESALLCKEETAAAAEGAEARILGKSSRLPSVDMARDSMEDNLDSVSDTPMRRAYIIFNFAL